MEEDVFVVWVVGRAVRKGMLRGYGRGQESVWSHAETHARNMRREDICCVNILRTSTQVVDHSAGHTIIYLAIVLSLCALFMSPCELPIEFPKTIN